MSDKETNVYDYRWLRSAEESERPEHNIISVAMAGRIARRIEELEIALADEIKNYESACEAADSLQAKLDAKLSCDVCAGTGKVPHGTCICGGSGHMHDEVDGLRRENYALQAKLDAVTWKVPVEGEYPDGVMLIQVDLSSGEKDTALVYLDDDCETLRNADGYGDVWTAFEWNAVSRYILLEALQQEGE